MLVTEHQLNGANLTACVNVLQQALKTNGEILMETAEGSLCRCILQYKSKIIFGLYFDCILKYSNILVRIKEGNGAT